MYCPPDRAADAASYSRWARSRAVSRAMAKAARTSTPAIVASPTTRGLLKIDCSPGRRGGPASFVSGANFPPGGSNTGCSPSSGDGFADVAGSSGSAERSGVSPVSSSTRAASAPRPSSPSPASSKSSTGAAGFGSADFFRFGSRAGFGWLLGRGLRGGLGGGLGGGFLRRGLLRAAGVRPGGEGIGGDGGEFHAVVAGGRLGPFGPEREPGRADLQFVALGELLLGDGGAVHLHAGLEPGGHAVAVAVRLEPAVQRLDAVRVDPHVAGLRPADRQRRPGRQRRLPNLPGRTSNIQTRHKLRGPVENGNCGE